MQLFIFIIHIHMYTCTTHVSICVIFPVEMFTILLLGPLSFIDNLPPPKVPSPNFFYKKTTHFVLSFFLQSHDPIEHSFAHV
jgi:hypothetical protein